ncbi:MAG: RNA polymerase subunit sigma-70 [Porphyromonadaceae bacterium CG2_30_38_12]|nr:MAG: RNA polymerase subunit sigma-70 [Porphyromonadaceae bacterium CG2_30_38_12]
MNINEQILIYELKKGSLKAFNEIYRMYSKRLYNYSVQFTKSSVEAEEIVQDVFVKIWQSREKILQKETLRSLLFIMAKHLLINAYRSTANHLVYEEYVDYLDVVSTENAHVRMEYDEFESKVYKVIKELPHTQQEVIALSRFQNLTNKEIAQKLSLSEQTVKNQLSLGLKTLKDKVKYLWIIMIAFIFNYFSFLFFILGTLAQKHCL